MSKQRICSREVDQALCVAESLDYTLITSANRDEYVSYLSYLSDTAQSVARGVRTRHYNRVSAKINIKFLKIKLGLKAFVVLFEHVLCPLILRFFFARCEQASAVKSRLSKTDRLQYLRQKVQTLRAELRERKKWAEAREKLRQEVEALEARVISP